MASSPPILLSGIDGKHCLWNPTTLDALGKMEVFLEDAIVAQPELLGLESLRTGIHRPWKILRRVNLETPTTRGIEADVILLCASGHIVIVEVKRSVNPELRDRQVIAQLLDYATSVQTLTENDLLETFRSDADSAPDWPSLVARWFSAEPDPDDLARHFLKRLERGEVHLVIACDRAPPGVAALVGALARQAATGFELDLVEIVPYVAADKPGEILLVPRPRLSTEIVACTAVTVDYRAVDGRPTTRISTTSIDEIEEHVRATERGDSGDYREWSLADIEAEVATAKSPVMNQLLEFCKANSYGDRIIATGKKVNPQFGFNIPSRRDGGPISPMMIFNCNAHTDRIYLYLNFVERAVGRAGRDRFANQMKDILGPSFRVDRPEQYIGFAVLSPRIADFEAAVLALKDEASSLAGIGAK